MTTPRTFRVLVRTTETRFIDLAAGDERTALARAERLWDNPGHRCRFDRVVGCEPASFEIDHYASDNLADVANEDRAQWAEKALRAFVRETGSDMGREALHDLVCDLGHYADQLGLDFPDELRMAAETWAEEKAEEGGAV